MNFKFHLCASTGVVTKMKMQRTIVIRRDYLHYIRKYNRFEKRHKNISVHLSPCFRYYTSCGVINLSWQNFDSLQDMFLQHRKYCSHAFLKSQSLSSQKFKFILSLLPQFQLTRNNCTINVLQMMFFLTMVFQAQEALTTLPLANTDAAWLHTPSSYNC